MRYFAIVLAIAMALLLVATAAAQQTVTVRLDPQNNSGISGTATLVAQGNQTRVIVNVTGEPPGADMPIHIHTGQCGPTLNPQPAYPLHDVVNGTSTTVVNVPLSTLTTGQYAINMHQSPTNIQRYVACGNIPPTPSS